MPLDVNKIRARLPRREVVWFDRIDSTMPEAARLAASGAPAGTLVLAEEQTAGQGRQGRSWFSERGSGLYISIVLRPAVDAGSMPVLTLALGLAAQEAIESVTGVPCDLRWPNDLLAGGKKCAGILCQSADSAVVAGIGIDVNHEAFPAELSNLATSLRMMTGGPHSREDLLVELAAAVDKYCKLLEERGADHVLHLYAERARVGSGF